MIRRRKLPPIHPGEILLQEFMEPMKVSQCALARAMDVPPRRINEIVLGKRGITADTPLRLGQALGTTPDLWLGLQADFDMDCARDALGARLKRIKPLAA